MLTALVTYYGFLINVYLFIRYKIRLDNHYRINIVLDRYAKKIGVKFRQTIKTDFPFDMTCGILNIKVPNFFCFK